MIRLKGQEMGRITAELIVANDNDVKAARAGWLPPDQVREVKLTGVVDTGATRLVLPEKVVAQLGLPSAGTVGVRYADQRSASKPYVEDVWLSLLGRHGVYTAIVEPDRSDALIGAIILEDLDLLVDCHRQVLYPRDPNQIISEID